MLSQTKGFYLRQGLLVNVLRIGLLAICLKLLLIPHEPSTDFEVHRHWLSLTSSLPISKWYTDESSKWTLDYPPLFAYYTLLLSKFASFFDPAVLVLSNHDYTSPTAHLFMRFTVILSDLFLIASVYLFLKSYSSTFTNPLSIQFMTQTAALVIFNPAIFLIDNLHFQYNTLPLSFLLLTLAALYWKKNLQACILFIITIHLKHTFLPAAPVIFVHLVCSSSFIVLLKIAVITVFLIIAIWAPFLVQGLKGVVPVIRRLFPFDRGLFHSYWAPNFWALYATIDKLLSKIAPILNLPLREPDIDPASGLVGGLKPFRVLPNVDAKSCAILTLVLLMPVLLVTARNAWMLKRHRKWSNASKLTEAVGFSCLGAFAVGFHVHEKAILSATVPLGAVAIGHHNNCIAMEFIVLAVAGHYAVFPLVSEIEVALYKVFHFAAYQLYMMMTLSQGVNMTMALYLWSWVAVELYSGIGGAHYVVFGRDTLPYLPLIVVALYSACGVLGASLLYLRGFVTTMITWSHAGKLKQK